MADAFRHMDLKNYLYYPAEIIQHEDGVSVAVINDGSSPDTFDRWLTSGKDLADARKMASAVIIDMADSLIKDKQAVPAAGAFKEGLECVAVPYHTALKIMLRNLMLQERWRPADLCKKLGWKSQEFNSAMNLRKKTALDTLAEIFAAIDRPLQISC